MINGHTKVVFDDMLGPHDGQNATSAADGLALRYTIHSAPPDVAEIAIPPLCPLGNSGISDSKAGVERHAVRGGMGPIDWRLALLAHR